ncbi:hypothetical protein HOB85_05115 [Candidatus Woesearchaeota archaeon]|jgi:hypothetical protein|nr:hypothetical protein [Candidatus Woesearchaeota archaeon]
MEVKKEKYLEGNCEVCENFAQLHERDGKYICAECMEQQGEQPKEDEI